MSRIVSESLGPAVWRAGLSDPNLHWKRGRSAWEAAVSWESQSASHTGLPQEIDAAFSRHPSFQRATLLLGIVEHTVILDDPKRPSQNDLWGVLLTDEGHVSMAVEAKAGEDFDKPLGVWLKSDSEGKEKRLAFLCNQLGLQKAPPDALRYQLFHRSVSAVLEARRWRFPTALMLVQSFEESRTSWQDYAAFASFLGLDARRNEVSGPRALAGIALFLAWVDSPKADDRRAASAV